MSEIGDIVKILIEKGGFKTFLASLLGSILFYKLILNDWLWALVVFAGCYLVFRFVDWLWKQGVKRYESAIYKAERIQKAEDEKMAQYKRLCIVYNSLTPMTQQRLIELYKLPQETYSNVRILNNMPYQHPILQVCCDMLHKYHIIDVEEGIGTYIITIKSEFCEVLAEHISDFE